MTTLPYIRVSFVMGASDHARIPEYATSNAAGLDLYASEGGVLIDRLLVNTGISIVFPEGHYGRIAARSGMALHHGIQIGGGVIDPDFTGEIKVLLINCGEQDIQIDAGTKIAQLIIEKYARVEVYTEDAESIETVRGEGTSKGAIRGSAGFGSTGK